MVIILYGVFRFNERTRTMLLAALNQLFIEKKTLFRMRGNMEIAYGI